MSILSGYKKVKNYIETGSGKKLLSRWTSSNTVEFNDGKTAQTKVGAIKGITTSTSATETGYAADATTVAALNQSLGNIIYITTHKRAIIQSGGDNYWVFTQFPVKLGYARYTIEVRFTGTGSSYMTAYHFDYSASDRITVYTRNFGSNFNGTMYVTCMYVKGEYTSISQQ